MILSKYVSALWLLQKSSQPDRGGVQQQAQEDPVPHRDGHRHLEEEVQHPQIGGNGIVVYVNLCCEAAAAVATMLRGRGGDDDDYVVRRHLRRRRLRRR